ncbi:MAG: hypothetical protein IT382_25650 [Deltaproteobacteria bacterium]|nr:hypothetical protein [Deltaproteobacteria bacterium]
MAAKEQLNRVVEHTGEFVRDRWGAFRRESPYFQARVWLIAGYLAIVGATIILAPPEGEKWQVEAQRLGFGLSFKTVVSITNLDNGDLEGVVVEVRGKGIEFDGKEVPGVWRTKPVNLPEEAEVRILTEHLFDEKGVNPPYALTVSTVTVRDDDGDVLLSVAPRQVGANQ